MGILKISLFGSVSARHEESLEKLRLTPVLQELLAYLLLNNRYPQPRDVLAEQFWGEYSQDRARGCLKTALWRLRCLLEPKGIPRGTYLFTTTRGDIGFNRDSPYWLDVEIFLQQVTPILNRFGHEGGDTDASACRAAISLYTGDFLEGFYDNWAIHQREQLRIIYLDALVWLVHYYKKQAEYEKSLDYARKVLEMDPLHEEIHRETMRLYNSMGLRVQALQQFEICQKSLKQELGIRPMEETLQLYRLILAGKGQLVTPLQLENSDLLAGILSRIRSGQKAVSRAEENFHEAEKLLEELLLHYR